MKIQDNKKIYSEYETRRNLLSTAEYFGCKKEMLQIFDKYDRALKKCTNETERKHIAACGAAEIHRLFGCSGSLEVDSKVIIPAKE